MIATGNTIKRASERFPRKPLTWSYTSATVYHGGT